MQCGQATVERMCSLAMDMGLPQRVQNTVVGPGLPWFVFVIVVSPFRPIMYGMEIDPASPAGKPAVPVPAARPCRNM